MYSRQAVVQATVGLHARPAAAFVRAVNGTGFAITLSKAGMAPVDARSLLAVMSADFECGTLVEVAVDGETPEHISAVDGLADLLSTELSE